MSGTHAHENSEEHNWATYHNDRFGFSFAYPTDVFELERGTEERDGQSLVSLDGDARVLVGTWRNSGNLDPASYRDHFAKRSYKGFSITHRRLSENRFVLTGEGKGKRFYEKVVFSCRGRLISSVAMIYPLERREVFEGLIGDIEKSFQPGSMEDCQAATQSHSRKTPPSAQTAQSRARDGQLARNRRADSMFAHGYGRPYMGR